MTSTSDLGTVEERDRHAFCARDHVQIGQDRSVIDDHDAGADAVHPLARAGFVVLVVAAHADHRRHDRGRGLGRARGQRLVLQRVQDGGIDVVLRQFTRRGLHAIARNEQRQRNQHAAKEQQGAVVTLYQMNESVRVRRPQGQRRLRRAARPAQAPDRRAPALQRYKARDVSSGKNSTDE